MSDKRLVKVVLGVASLAFIATPLILLFGGIFQSNSAHNNDTYSVVEANQQEQLQALAAGYEEVIEREPDNLVALQGLMQTRLQLNQVEEAIAPMAKLSELDPDNLQLALVLGQARIQAGRTEEAIAQLSSLQQENPDNTLVANELGQAYANAGQHENAIAVYEDLVERNPNNDEASLQLAEALTRSDRRPEAIEIFDRLIEDDSDNFQAIAGKAIAIASNPEVTDEERGEAEIFFEQARSAAPPSVRVQIAQIAQQYLNPVPVEIMTGDTGEAIQAEDSGSPDAAAE